MILHWAGFGMYLMGGVGMLIKDYNEAVLVAGAASIKI